MTNAPGEVVVPPHRDLGRADAQPFLLPGGPTACLLLHGLTSTPYEVREIGLALHQAGYTVQAIRLPGHGTRPEDLKSISWTDWTRAALAARDELAHSYGRVFAVGSSLGGSLALWLATERPLSGVVGLGTPIRLHRITRTARFLARVRPLVPKKRGYSSIRDPEARVRHPSYGATATRAIAEMVRLLDRLRSRLPEITAPVLLLHSRHDSVVSPSNAVEAYEAIGSSDKTLLWVNNSDHIISEDYDKHLVIQATIEFLDRVGGTTG